jgi:hypothetical protein
MIKAVESEDYQKEVRQVAAKYIEFKNYKPNGTVPVCLFYRDDLAHSKDNGEKLLVFHQLKDRINPLWCPISRKNNNIINSQQIEEKYQSKLRKRRRKLRKMKSGEKVN